MDPIICLGLRLNSYQSRVLSTGKLLSCNWDHILNLPDYVDVFFIFYVWTELLPTNQLREVVEIVCFFF